MRTTWLAQSVARTLRHIRNTRLTVLTSSTSSHVHRPCCPSSFRGYSSTRGCLSSPTTYDASQISPTVAIIGSGPAGFYTARHLQRHLSSPRVEIYDRLPVPFGLVRYGVAPDHPEVKNCIEDFEHVARDEHARFIGNVQLGENVELQSLVRNYDVVVFAYGASKDRQLGLEKEDTLGVLSARAFVGWYNGLPEYRDLNPDLSQGEAAIIIGQGNVALDCARILLSDVNELKKTDITRHALETLRKSKVRSVSVVGRRGPMQAAFTIKEIRELVNLPNINFECKAAELFPPDLKSLPRPKKRLMELLLKGNGMQRTEGHKSCILRFCLAPIKLLHQDDGAADARIRAVEFEQMALDDIADPKSKVRPTGQTTILNTSLLLRSIGYKAEPLPGMKDIGVNFDEERGMLKHDGVGRLILSDSVTGNNKQTTQTHTPPKAALYCAGWVKRGPTGVIASTMTDAFQTAEAIIEDIKHSSSINTNLHYINDNDNNDDEKTKSSDSSESNTKRGWPAVKAEAEAQGRDLSKVVDWRGWKMIDEAEKARGREDGKPREKIVDVGLMEQAAGVSK